MLIFLIFLQIFVIHAIDLSQLYDLSNSSQMMTALRKANDYFDQNQFKQAIELFEYSLHSETVVSYKYIILFNLSRSYQVC